MSNDLKDELPTIQRGKFLVKPFYHGNPTYKGADYVKEFYLQYGADKEREKSWAEPFDTSKPTHRSIRKKLLSWVLSHYFGQPVSCTAAVDYGWAHINVYYRIAHQMWCGSEDFEGRQVYIDKEAGIVLMDTGDDWKHDPFAYLSKVIKDNRQRFEGNDMKGTFFHDNYPVMEIETLHRGEMPFPSFHLPKDVTLVRPPSPGKTSTADLEAVLRAMTMGDVMQMRAGSDPRIMENKLRHHFGRVAEDRVIEKFAKNFSDSGKTNGTDGTDG
jgi:hypothetical protein